MVAIHTHPRLGFDSLPPAKIRLPATSHERGRLWSDAVFEAVLTLKNQLASRNDAVAANAANSILELERTRMRHDKTVAGSSLDCEEFGDREPASDRLEVLGELPDLGPLDSGPPEVDVLAEHTAEVLAAIPMIGANPTTRPSAERLVRRFLNEQVIEAEDIEPGQFIANFRRKLRETAVSALPS